MLLNDLMHNRKPKPGPILIGGEEGVEDATEVLRRYAESRILHDHLDSVAQRPPRESAHITGPDRQRSLGGHRLQRIQDQVQNRLLQQPGAC
jgi:hypothetical protein